MSRNWRLLTEWVKLSLWQVGQCQKHGANSNAASRQARTQKSIPPTFQPWRKTPAAASKKHIRTFVPLSQPRRQTQTSAGTPTFSGPLMIYLGKTECYLLGEMRRVLVEEWYGRCWEASVRQMILNTGLLLGAATVCAYLHNSHTNIGPYLISRLQTSAGRGSGRL